MVPGPDTTDHDRMLSTGKVAQLLSVKPDTVLKWIKSGRLPAKRTAGGHYRIAQHDIDGLIDDGTEPSPVTDGGFVYCWEYYGSDGSPSENCTDCLVYRARARLCYEMSGLAKETGYAGAHCSNSCEECAYFLEVVRRTRRVVIVTTSDDLRNKLLQEIPNSRFEVAFASSEYECAATCHDFRPEFVVIDGSLSKAVRASLCSHLAKDPRVAGVQIILAQTHADDGLHEQPATGSGVDRAIPRTFGLAELEKHIIGLEVKPAALA